MVILIRETLLHYFAGTSDKIYKVLLYKNGNTGRYEVHTEYGRRMGNQIANSIQEYISIAHAQNIYNKTVNSKLKKGYTISHELEPSRFTADYIVQLLSDATRLVSYGDIKEEQYVSIKNMLNSSDEPSQVLAEEIIKSKKEKKVA